ncbi:hypothetical protein F9278_24960 [Streptomyces phaeolivaceus]|uniref:Uncharacterized protein n=1 Tax=Streptomyces phaeolivaceus TaxID=2653200 RepID=A0A5P8K6X9_9ACTN|nr:hypothetical protein F9278_24960 [Streptomyces phaeolivaceus]
MAEDLSAVARFLYEAGTLKQTRRTGWSGGVDVRPGDRSRADKTLRMATNRASRGCVGPLGRKRAATTGVGSVSRSTAPPGAEAGPSSWGGRYSVAVGRREALVASFTSVRGRSRYVYE